MHEVFVAGRQQHRALASVAGAMRYCVLLDDTNENNVIIN